MPGNRRSKERPEEPDAPGSPGQSRVSRRSVLGAAGVGAAGLAAGAFGGIAAAAPAVAVAKPAPRPHGDSADRPDSHVPSDSDEQVVVHLRPRSGELDVFSGTSHTRLHDPDLAARLRRTIR